MISKAALQGMEVNGSRDYVRSAVEASLARLQIKQIDLYYQVYTSVRPSVHTDIAQCHV